MVSSLTPAKGITASDIALAVSRYRETGPLVQCLTNKVVTGWTANVLLASGAAPAMVDNPHEAGEFAEAASAVLINLGTPCDDTVAAMYAAASHAIQAETPWVLDPVAAGPLAWRTAVAGDLLATGPTIVRGNASEILALGGGSGGRGPESVDMAEDAVLAAHELAGRTGGAVAVSGVVDHIVAGDDIVRLSNGHPWLTKVTGVGCALGALMAGYAAVSAPLLAAAAATAHLTVAAEHAAAVSSGPGSFAVNLLDALESLTPEQVSDRLVLE